MSCGVEGGKGREGAGQSLDVWMGSADPRGPKSATHGGTVKAGQCWEWIWERMLERHK